MKSLLDPFWTIKVSWFAAMLMSWGVLTAQDLQIEEVRFEASSMSDMSVIAVELKNITDDTINTENYVLCNFPDYVAFSELEVLCGDLQLAPDEEVTVSGLVVGTADSELGIYINGSNFGSADLMVDYVEWGESDHVRSSVAVAAGVWTAGDFVDSPENGQSLESDDDGDTAAEWEISDNPSICDDDDMEEEFTILTPMDSAVITIEGCDSSALITASSSVIEDEDDVEYTWELALTPSFVLSAFDITSDENTFSVTYGEVEDLFASQDVAIGDTVVLYHRITARYDDEEMVTEPAQVSLIRGELRPVDGGMIATDSSLSVEVCAGDGEQDSVFVDLVGEVGLNSQWIVTDTNGVILGLPPVPEVVDFENAGVGVCLIWHLSYDGEISGLTMDSSAADITGDCFDLSNSITVYRVTCEMDTMVVDTMDMDTMVVDTMDMDSVICDVDGGMIDAGGFTTVITCANDGEADNIVVDIIGALGDSSQWIVTDTNGVILGLPPVPEAVNFDSAGVGICLIWHLSYDGEISGLTMDSNATDIAGDCFDLSNSITVSRISCEIDTMDMDSVLCDVHGGMISTDSMESIEICAGDGEADSVFVDLVGAVGDSSQWIVTDTNGVILGLPPVPEVVDFENAGVGVCLIWHLSYDGEISGLTMDSSAADISGDCFDLSNSITVYRVTCEMDTMSCSVTAGQISTNDVDTSATVCVGDGEDDFISFDVANAEGESMVWLLTDTALNITMITNASEYNFEGTDPGVCLVWHLSYDGLIEGVETGLNAADISGCFALSNAIEITKVSGEDCVVDTMDMDTMVVDTMDMDTMVVDTMDMDTMVVDTMDMDTMVVDTMDMDTMVVDTMDMDTMVVDTMDMDTMVVDTMDMDTMVVDTMVVDTMDMDTMVVDTMDMDTMVVDTMDMDTMPDPNLGNCMNFSIGSFFFDGNPHGATANPVVLYVNRDGATPSQEPLLTDPIEEGEEVCLPIGSVWRIQYSDPTIVLDNGAEYRRVGYMFGGDLNSQIISGDGSGQLIMIYRLVKEATTTTDTTDTNAAVPQGNWRSFNGGDFAQEVSNFAVSAAPNPFVNSVQVKLSLDQSESIQIRLLNMNGQEVKRVSRQSLSAGDHQFKIMTDDLQRGAYLMEVNTDTRYTTKMIIKS